MRTPPWKWSKILDTVYCGSLPEPPRWSPVKHYSSIRNSSTCMSTSSTTSLYAICYLSRIVNHLIFNRHYCFCTRVGGRILLPTHNTRTCGLSPLSYVGKWSIPLHPPLTLVCFWAFFPRALLPLLSHNYRWSKTPSMYTQSIMVTVNYRP